MKTVTMRQTITGAVKIYEAGRTYDVSDYQAIRWKKAGLCEPTATANVSINTTLNGKPVEVEVMAIDTSGAEKAVKKPKRKRQRKSKEG